jgi:ubiquinone/menaquinone biosynthesis C-methylase UbiE
MTTHTINPELAVRRLYTEAAKKNVGYCCPVPYDAALLANVPDEVRERDYGCGDPTPHLRRGETVLDLGSGGGKGVFLAAQAVGRDGRVIGVDMNDDMLSLAQRNVPAFHRKVGFDNVEFHKARVQDLALNLDKLDVFLESHPVRTSADLAVLNAEMARLREREPLISDASVDVVISDCVLNLVRPSEKEQLFAQIHRVLKMGGRAVISDIVSDEDVPLAMQANPELWTGCISGAMREDRFLQAFEQAGLYGMLVLARDAKPWRTVEGIEFRSVTVVAYKGKEGPCMDHKQAVIYRGPFREVLDDDGHRLPRGVRVAVCAKTFGLYSREPYRSHMDLVEPLHAVKAGDALPFPCGKETLVRQPAETKGEDHHLTTSAPAACCGSGTC